MIPLRDLPKFEVREKKVVIKAPDSTRDANGQPTPTYVDFATLWASIEDLSGREFVAANATQNSALTRIGIDYIEGIEANMRVVHGSTIYNIEAVLGQDKRSLMLMCKRLA